MSIRTILLTCLFTVMALFVSAVGWLSARGTADFQRNLVRTFHRELLNEGSPEFLTALHQLYALHENLPAPMRTGDIARDLAPFLSPEDADRYLFLDGNGTPAAGHPLDPALQPLAEAAVLADFWESAKKGGTRELAIDNYTDYLDGKADTPATLHLRAYPDQNLMLGMGRRQDITDVRLESFAEIATAAYNTLIRRAVGLYACLILLALTLVGFTFQQLFFRPLVRYMRAAAPENGGAARGRLTWRRFREYTERLEVLEHEKQDQRGKLEREIEARFQAESERDALTGSMNRKLDAFKADLQSQAGAHLAEIEAAILQRESRVLLNQLLPGLESALRALPESAGLGQARESINRCLLTVRALGDKRPETLLELRETSLQPWLEGIVDRFKAIHEVPVLANIGNDARARIEPEALGQAVEFVMENAAIASRNGAGIRVDSVRDGELIEIRIVDNGRGISGEARPHVFIPFFSLDAQNNGLGLAVTRSVVEQHGGSIQIHTESEKGTAVIIRLPAA